MSRISSQMLAIHLCHHHVHVPRRLRDTRPQISLGSASGVPSYGVPFGNAILVSKETWERRYTTRTVVHIFFRTKTAMLTAIVSSEVVVGLSLLNGSLALIGQPCDLCSLMNKHLPTSILPKLNHDPANSLHGKLKTLGHILKDFK
jgi:hypothetical protein